MKLLVVSNMYPNKAYPSYGVFVKNFCDQLDALGIDYRLAVMHKSSNKLQKLTGYITFYLKSFLCSLLGKYDAVYVHYASHSSPGVLLARKLRNFPIITNCHGSDVMPQNQQQEKMQKLTRQILSCSKKVVVPSEYFKRIVTEKYSLPADRVFVCASGGIDTQLFRPEELQNPPFTIGFVSRIEPGKGWDILLNACAKLPDRDFRLLMVGGGRDSEKLQTRVQQLALTQQVHTVGLQPQKNLPNYLNQMDVFVFPTELAESLGLVALEAMACGVPVIASDFAAPAYYVVDGKNGYKFPVGDSKSLADAICKFRSLPLETRQQLREGALETGKEYATEAVTAALKTILLE